MGGTVRAWRKRIEELAFEEGLRQLEWTMLGSHQRLSGAITVRGGRVVAVGVVVSVSPSDHRAALKVRTDIRRAIAASRKLEER
jgi:hypothetical protein